MKQCSFYLRDISGFDAVAQSFRETCPQEARAMLVSVFSGWDDEEETSALLRRLSEMLPEAVVFGTTSAGEILSGYLSEQTAILNFVFFDATEVRLHTVDFSVAPPEEGAALLAEQLKSEAAAGIGIFLANNDRQSHGFLSNLHPLPEHAKVFGAIAGSSGPSGSRVFAGARAISQGAVVLSFIGEELRIQLNVSVGWQPLGPSFAITKMDGDNVIRELDGNSPKHIYKKYLTLSPEDIRHENLLFPLCVKRDGHKLMRLPSECTDDGALIIGGDCREGELVRLAYGDPGKILDASYKARLDIMNFAPEAILMLNCVSRRFFLREDANQELRPFPKIAPSVGFYVHGEIIGNRHGGVSLLNMSLVTASFREGAQSEDYAAPIELAPRTQDLNDMMKLVHCLANFVEVTSTEAEMANEQLTTLASIDRLTGLYNRGETETIFRKELLRNRGNDRVLSVIMIDLDDFKSVNDTFGHAVGDRVLRWSARALQENIRRGDAAGRWGGEEFLIILPGARLQDAAEVAERIRTAFEAGHILPDGRSVTGSIGVAQYPERGNIMVFYRNLDQALYRAKEEGKNRVCLVEE
ncbi:MAG: diguanylate cyclase [Schwartzia sp.]|nr:diguanylate cyclase [Schwartzia sp. (in: firmicutes)]